MHNLITFTQKYWQNLQLKHDFKGHLQKSKTLTDLAYFQILLKMLERKTSSKNLILRYFWTF